MSDRLNPLGETLLRAGFAPRHVRRYLGELADHRDDIAEALERGGLSPDAARQEAERRLGSTDALLLPMLARRRFISPAARWPALFYTLLPLAAQLALTAAGLILLVHLAATPLRAHVVELGAALAAAWLAIPVLIAWLTQLAARRRRADARFTVLGAVAGAALASALHLEVTRSAAGGGELALALAVPALLPLLALCALSLLPLSLKLVRSWSK